MPEKLRRYYGRGDFHFITFCCFRRLRLLGSPDARNAFVAALDEVRAKYRVVLAGYVVMPEHVHLLIGESEAGNPSTVVQSLKLRVSKRLRAVSAPNTREFERFWQRRFYDFNVYGAEKRLEKLDYMHRNPVARRLVSDPLDWIWSSYAAYSQRVAPLIGVDFVS
jgi:putative transposase